MARAVQKPPALFPPPPRKSCRSRRSPRSTARIITFSCRSWFRNLNHASEPLSQLLQLAAVDAQTEVHAYDQLIKGRWHAAERARFGQSKRTTCTALTTCIRQSATTILLGMTKGFAAVIQTRTGTLRCQITLGWRSCNWCAPIMLGRPPSSLLGEDQTSSTSAPLWGPAAGSAPDAAPASPGCRFAAAPGGPAPDAPPEGLETLCWGCAQDTLGSAPMWCGTSTKTHACHACQHLSSIGCTRCIIQFDVDNA